MSKTSDLIHASRLEVEVLDTHVKQSIRKHRHIKATETWKREKKLGAGGFGTVYLETCSQHEHKVRAVKQLAKSGGVDYNRELEAAALFSQQLYEGCFVKSFGWYESPTSIYLTMEYLPLGDLQQYMGSAFPESEARLIVAQVLEGLNHMHERDFTHRDLKPANILVCEKGPQWWVKLTDFGISKREVDGISGLHTHVYTPQFVAPEVLFEKYQYTRAVDVWSLGIMTFLLLSGGNAVFRTQPDLLAYWSSRMDLPVEKLVLRNISNKGQQFVQSLLSPQPHDRPDVRACLEHTWLATDSGTLKSFRALQMKCNVATSAATEFAPWTTKGQEFSADIATEHTQWTTTDRELPVATTGSAAATRQAAQRADKIFQPQIEAPYPPFSLKPFESSQDSGFRGPSVSNADAATVDILAADKSDHATSSVSHPDPYETRSGGTDAHTLSPPAPGTFREHVTSGTKDGVVRSIVQPKTIRWKACKRLQGREGRVHGLAFSPDGHFVVSGSEDGTVSLWDVATGKEVKRFKGHAFMVLAVAFSPDGSLIGSGGYDGTIRLWNVATGTEVKRLESNAQGIEKVAFSPDGRLVVSGSRGRMIRLWNVATGAEVKCLEGHSAMVTSVAFSTDGRLVASGSRDKTIRLWDEATGVEVKRLEGHTKGVLAVVVSLDGQLVASGSMDNTIRTWNVATGAETIRINGPSSTFREVAFSPDGQIVGTGSSDGTIRLWDIATGEEVKRLEGHRESIRAMAFSLDGRFLASSATGGASMLWDMKAPGAVIKYGGARAYMDTLGSFLRKDNTSI